MKRVNLELSEELLAQIDAERGDVPRNAWIRRAIEQRLAPQPDDADQKQQEEP